MQTDDVSGVNHSNAIATLFPEQAWNIVRLLYTLHSTQSVWMCWGHTIVIVNTQGTLEHILQYANPDNRTMKTKAQHVSNWMLLWYVHVCTSDFVFRIQHTMCGILWSYKYDCLHKKINFQGGLTNTLATTKTLVHTSVSFLAELSVSSPQKLFIFIILKKKIWIKVSKKYFI